MKVTAIIRPERKDSEGLCPVLIRISKEKNRRYITTAFKVKPAQFQKGKVVKHPDAHFINAELASQMADAQQSFKSDTRLTFQSFAKAFIAHHEKAGTRAKGVIRYYNSQLDKFTNFAGDKLFSQITPDLIKSYQVHMKGLGNQHNGMWNSLKFLKLIIQAAIKDGVIYRNPFDRVDNVTYKQSVRTFLTTDEVRRIVELELEPGTPLFKISRWFLIQCYTGARAGDLRKISLEQIKRDGRLIVQTSKTGAVVSQEVSDKLLSLIEQAGTFDITLEDYNRNLKLLAASAKINKVLTSHVGRHTLAMRWLEIGNSIETLPSVLGHASLSTTKIYAKMRDERVDKDMRKLSY